MKISILLPYKENYSPSYPGAVSLFVNSVLKKSMFKNETTIYGSTKYKDKLSSNYVNIPLSKEFLKMNFCGFKLFLEHYRDAKYSTIMFKRC